MTKYIKTDTNIFEVVEENELIYYVRSVKNKHKIYSKSKCNTIIKNMSDNLDRLCDLFIAITQNDEYDFYKYIFDNTTLQLALNKNYYKAVYGAIYTDTGIKYVSKLDAKGNLQLL